jgi:hypothetical protein
VFSQNGEDGIIQHIFERIGVEANLCCEFGAWDGVHFSNCRNLVLQGWHAIMIEGDHEKYIELVETYKGNPAVKTVHCFVDTTTQRLDRVLHECGISSLDFLSIDIDGPDYEILLDMEIRPRVICIEVNAGHNPGNQSLIPIHTAKNNIGQPLAAFTKLAAAKGYNLVCYTGNAFFVEEAICRRHRLPTLSSDRAYENFLHHLTKSEKEWLYLVNLGIVPPYHKFSNPFLDASSLGINEGKAFALRLTSAAKEFVLKRARLARQLLH